MIWQKQIRSAADFRAEFSRLPSTLVVLRPQGGESLVPAHLATMPRLQPVERVID